MLQAAAGAPPSAVALLETYAQLGSGAAARAVPDLGALGGRGPRFARRLPAARLLPLEPRQPVVDQRARDGPRCRQPRPDDDRGPAARRGEAVQAGGNPSRRGHREPRLPRRRRDGLRRSDFDAACDRLEEAGYAIADGTRRGPRSRRRGRPTRRGSRGWRATGRRRRRRGSATRSPSACPSTRSTTRNEEPRRARTPDPPRRPRDRRVAPLARRPAVVRRLGRAGDRRRRPGRRERGDASASRRRRSRSPSTGCPTAAAGRLRRDRPLLRLERGRTLVTPRPTLPDPRLERDRRGRARQRLRQRRRLRLHGRRAVPPRDRGPGHPRRRGPPGGRRDRLPQRDGRDARRRDPDRRRVVRPHGSPRSTSRADGGLRNRRIWARPRRRRARTASASTPRARSGTPTCPTTLRAGPRGRRGAADGRDRPRLLRLHARRHRTAGPSSSWRPNGTASRRWPIRGERASSWASRSTCRMPADPKATVAAGGQLP